MDIYIFNFQVLNPVITDLRRWKIENNAQINPAGYLAKGNVKINLFSPKMKIWYK